MLCFPAPSRPVSPVSREVKRVSRTQSTADDTNFSAVLLATASAASNSSRNFLPLKQSYNLDGDLFGKVRCRLKAGVVSCTLDISFDWVSDSTAQAGLRRLPVRSSASGSFSSRLNSYHKTPTRSSPYFGFKIVLSGRTRL